MAFVRTGLIIVALLMSWVAVRWQPAAHEIRPQATLSQTSAHRTS